MSGRLLQKFLMVIASTVFVILAYLAYSNNQQSGVNLITNIHCTAHGYAGGIDPTDHDTVILNWMQQFGCVTPEWFPVLKEGRSYCSSVFVCSSDCTRSNNIWTPQTAIDIFYSTLGTVQAKYVQEVSTDRKTIQALWVIMFFWHVCTIIYLLVSLCLPPEKSPVTVEPPLISVYFLLGWTVGMIGMIGYYFAFDREILRIAFALLLVGVFGFVFALATSYKLVYDNLIFLDNEETQALLWMVRTLIQNGLSIPTTVLTNVLFQNLANVIIYNDSFDVKVPILRDNITVEDGSSMVLALVLVSAIVWLIMENFLVEIYCRYTFTVFPTMIVMQSGLVSRLRDVEGTRNYAFAVVVLALCILAVILRVVLFFRRKKIRIAAAAVV